MNIVAVKISLDMPTIEEEYKKAIKTCAVVQNPNLPEAPMLWYQILRERKERKRLKYRFATMSELVLFFFTIKDTDMGKELYTYFLDLFLKKYNLTRQKNSLKSLSKQETEFIRIVGQNIYALEINQGLFFAKKFKGAHKAPIFHVKYLLSISIIPLAEPESQVPYPYHAD